MKTQEQKDNEQFIRTLKASFHEKPTKIHVTKGFTYFASTLVFLLVIVILIFLYSLLNLLHDILPIIIGFIIGFILTKVRE